MTVMLLIGVVVLAFISETEAAINPKPWLRVRKVWGIEEPASVTFSFLTLVAALVALYRHRRERSRHTPEAWRTYPYHWVWHTCLWSVALSSFCSVVFHYHETRPNERADYLCAMAQLILYLSSCLIRVFELKSRISQATLYFLGALGIAAQSWYMLFVKFHYGWHVRLGAVISVVFMVVWSVWGIWQIAKNKRKYCWWLLASTTSIAVCAPLELNDFRPIWRTFDAHSLWHASLVIMCSLFWEFCRLDFTDFAQNLATSKAARTAGTPQSRDNKSQ